MEKLGYLLVGITAGIALEEAYRNCEEIRGNAQGHTDSSAQRQNGLVGPKRPLQGTESRRWKQQNSARCIVRLTR